MPRFSNLFVAILLGCAAPAYSTTYVLNSQGTGDFSTIQDAIDAAVDGDEIVLEDGGYAGEGNHNLRFDGKAITLRSASGDPDQCVLVGIDANRGWGIWGITFDAGEGPDSVLDGIGFWGFACGSGDVDCPGVAVLAEGASPTIRSVHVTLSSFASQAPVVFRDSQSFVEGLRVTQSDKGIAAIGSTLTLEDCLIESNSSVESSGVGVISYNSNITIRSSRIRGNVQEFHGQPEGGAGIFASNSTLLIEDTEITDNESKYGGAILLKNHCALTIRRSTIAGNRAIEGGAIYTGLSGFGRGGSSSDVTLEHTIVRANCADVAGTEDASFGGTVFGMVDCSSVDTARMAGIAALTLGPANSFDDPLFCAPRACSAPSGERGIYTLQSGSPLLDFPGCGLIGLYGVQCTVSIQSMSWGQIKSQYLTPSLRRPSPTR